ncbi:MAG: hypothetical protein Q9163_001870 [Psora crenata]
MAERDIYKHDVDFATLALQSPAFNKHLKVNGQLDFSDPEAVHLLERDFSLRLDLPNDRLCPPVPNRLNYILWLQDLLDTTSDDYTDQPKWNFIATDIDPKNLEYAKRNVLQNKLETRIRPVQTKPTNPLIPLDTLGLGRIDFTMCNPPFYASSADLVASAASKSRPPHSACTGADVEMVTPGGEVAFVSRMIDESKGLGERCMWYTSMLGKSSSVEAVVQRIRAAGMDNWAVKDLVQGSKTRRWAVAWSWGSLRPPEAAARSTSTIPKHLLPFPPEHRISLIQSSVDACAEVLHETMRNLRIPWQYRQATATGLGFAPGNVWSRAARRKKQQDRGNPSPVHSPPNRNTDKEPALGFKIHLQIAQEGGVSMTIRWLRGRDSVLFESFCGMLKRQMTIP